MKHRLAPLQFLPPSINTSWFVPSDDPNSVSIKRDLGSDVCLPLPLFWYDPAWYQVTVEQADFLAVAVAEMDVLVSCLRSDVSVPSRDSIFHAGRMVDAEAKTKRRYGRLVPYRNERYGFSVADFDDASIIDLRIVVARDFSGRFAYSPAQIQRWEATPTTAPVAGGGWIPAASFPPDVVSMEHLTNKISQLRNLAPSAAIFLSVGPYRIDEELPALVNAKPDGLILRLDELSVEGLQLAEILCRTRQLLDQCGGEAIPLWVVPGEISPDDAVKLVAMGASAVAIDAWCNELLEQTESAQPHESMNEHSLTIRSHQYDSRWGDFATHVVGDRIERFRGLFESLQNIEKKERLGSYDPDWVKSLGVRQLR
ncbi:hypothetical protein Q31b_48410 [Novipirellula aureliae]|uniref:Uncharacterized protein n=1 Tax=Novipirellula aureliae TaxID=2527966 RepID=A0A5C6DI91_9BACT|nr:hypothetical protein [Novipirellula aureliae]TWU36560.1 hypothetical protein Q31b_48410 [Novipirellula aureliae]